MCTLLANGLSGPFSVLVPRRVDRGEPWPIGARQPWQPSPAAALHGPGRPSFFSDAPKALPLARPMPCRHVGECLFLVSLLVIGALSASLDDWCNGKHYTGTYKQTYDCLVVTPTVVNVGMLNITGVEKASLPSYLPRIWKLTSQVNKFRLFTVIDSGQLVLNKVILTGGDVEKVIGSELSWGGGAIYVSGPSTKVTIFDSILYNNRAYAGGSIYASNQTNVVVKNTSLGGITTTNTGGALWCGYLGTTCRITGKSSRQLTYTYQLTRKQKQTIYLPLNDQSVACPFYSNCIHD